MTVKYTQEHEWIQLADDGTAVVGITLHAQDALGDVVFVDLPEVGRSYAKGEVAGVVESVKAAADVYMPIDEAPGPQRVRCPHGRARLRPVRQVERLTRPLPHGSRSAGTLSP
jgi:hypothetical protein